MAIVKPWPGPVSVEMTNWAKSLVADPAHYPYGSETLQKFGDRTAMARIEHHTWTYRNGVRITGNFRGVTLYEIIETNLVKDPI